MNAKFTSKVEVDLSISSSELTAALSSAIGPGLTVSETMLDRSHKMNFAVVSWEADIDVRQYGIKSISLSLKDVNVREMIVLVGLLRNDTGSVEMVPLLLNIEYVDKRVEVTKNHRLEFGISPREVEIVINKGSFRGAYFDGNLSESGTLRITCEATATLKV